MSSNLLNFALICLVLSPLSLPYLVSQNSKSTLSFGIYFGPILALILSIQSYAINTPLILNSRAVFLPNENLGFYLDILSGFVLSFVLLIGAVTTKFSFRYLEIDKNRNLFLKSISYVLFSVTVMLLSDNFIQFFVFWVLTSYFLHKLLTHVKNDSEAESAARQKFWTSRLGDLFLLISISCFYVIFRSFNFSELVRTDLIHNWNNKWLLDVGCIFLVLGSITKSAQWPFQSWLPLTMNTPTPVSAIMHAGVINSGGYLLIRLSPLMNQSHLSLVFLTLIGALTAIIGVMVMWTQTDVKKSLAYSTISQMGFMMLQIGVGAYSLALIHMMGHAFYKAYSFLTIGQVVDYGRLNRIFASEKLKYNFNFAFSILFAILMTGVLYLIIDPNFSNKNQGLVLLGILSLSLSQVLQNSKNILTGLITCAAICVLYGLIYKISIFTFLDVLNLPKGMDSSMSLLIDFVLIFAFLTLLLMQSHFVYLNQHRFFRKIYVKLLNGF